MRTAVFSAKAYDRRFLDLANASSRVIGCRRQIIAIGMTTIRR